VKLAEARDIGFRYPGASEDVISNFNLKISLGEKVRISGRNGAGKSTLLRILAGQLQPSSGELRLYLQRPPVYMDQNASEMLNPALTISDHLKAFDNLPKQENYQNSTSEWLKSFDLGLDLRAEEFVGHLSGGQKQIVALLCTIASGSSLLCLDEFFSALDQKAVKAVVDIMSSEWVFENVSIVFVNHRNDVILNSNEIYLGDSD